MMNGANNSDNAPNDDPVRNLLKEVWRKHNVMIQSLRADLSNSSKHVPCKKCQELQNELFKYRNLEKLLRKKEQLIKNLEKRINSLEISRLKSHKNTEANFCNENEQEIFVPDTENEVTDDAENIFSENPVIPETNQFLTPGAILHEHKNGVRMKKNEGSDERLAEDLNETNCSYDNLEIKKSDSINDPDSTECDTILENNVVGKNIEKLLIHHKASVVNHKDSPSLLPSTKLNGNCVEGNTMKLPKDVETKKNLDFDQTFCEDASESSSSFLGNIRHSKKIGTEISKSPPDRKSSKRNNCEFFYSPSKKRSKKANMKQISIGDSFSMIKENGHNTNFQDINSTRLESNDDKKEELSIFRPIYAKKEEPGYKYQEVVRKQDERRKLDGHYCYGCEEYYKDLGLSDEEMKKRMKNCSRHRSKFSPPKCPENFWDIEFPDTQECQDKGYMNKTQTFQLRTRRRRPLDMKSNA